MFKRLLTTLVGLIILFSLTGFLLPTNQKVERSLVIKDTPEHIWEVIVDPPAWNRWSPWYERDPEMKISYTGAPKGEGARWSWESKTEGSGTMQIVRTAVARQLEYALAFDGMGGTATGQFLLSPADGGTRVVWSFESDAGLNPLARWFGLILDRMVGPDFEKGLANMAATLEKQGK